MNELNRPSLPNPWFALDLLIVGLLAMYVYAGYPTAPFHGDESMQIFMSHDYGILFQEGDLPALYYEPEKRLAAEVEQSLRLLNGTVNKYTIGIAWDAAGYTRDALNWPWYWDETVEFNRAGGFYPSDGLLLASRVPSTLFLCAAVVTMFFVGKTLAGRAVGYSAAAYMALNPAVLVNGRRAMMEGSLLLGAALVLLGGVWLVRSQGWRGWASAMTLALGAGFAVASKHTNVIAVASVFIGCGLYAAVLLWRDKTRRGAEMIAQILLAGTLAIALFFLLNPAYWQQPVEVARVVLDERVTLLDGQVNVFGGYGSLAGRIGGFYRQSFESTPMYYEARTFERALDGQIATYEATPYAGISLPGVGMALLAAFIVGCFVLYGFVRLIDVERGTRWVIGTYTLLTTVFLMFSVPLEWQRYYLPMAPVIALVAPLGVLWVIRLYMRDATTHSPQYHRGSARAQRSQS